MKHSKIVVIMLGLVLSVGTLVNGGLLEAQAQLNTPPVINVLSGPLTLSCNQTGTYNVTASDVDSTTLNVVVSWGDGSADSTATLNGAVGTNLSQSFTHSYSTNGTMVINTVVSDSSGATAAQMFSTTISGCGAPANQPPVINVFSGPLTLTCSQTGTYNVTVSDVDSTTINLALSWGDGSADSTATLNGAVGTNLSQSFTHSYNSNGAKSLTLSVNDGAGGIATQNFTTTISGCGAPANQPPVINVFSGPLTLTCSQTGTYNVTVSDVDSTTINLALSWGDGSADSTATLNGAVGTNLSQSFTHSYNSNGAKVINLVASDSAGATAVQMFSTSISGCGGGGGNQPPVINVFSGPLTLTCNQAGTYNVTVSDADSTTLNLTLAWGDGSANSTATLNGAVGTNLSQSFTHAYSGNATNTITLTVTDPNSASASQNFSTTVSGCGGGGGGGGGSGTGGLGGGGGSSGCNTFNTPEANAVNISIDGQSIITTSEVTVNLQHNNTVKAITLSNYADFHEQTSIPLVGTQKWSLLAGTGYKTVYARFAGSDNTCYVTKSADATMIAPNPNVLGEACINIAAEKNLVTNVDKNLTNKLKGQLLIQVEGENELWYLDPATGNRYFLPSGEDYYDILLMFATGISNTDINRMPIGLLDYPGSDLDKDSLPDFYELIIGTSQVSPDTDGDGFNDRMEIANGFDPFVAGQDRKIDAKFTANNHGRFFIQVESAGEMWYINPTDNKRYYIPKGIVGYNLIKQLGTGITDANLRKIAVGDQVKGQSLASASVCYPVTPKVAGATDTKLPRTGMLANGLMTLPFLLAQPWLRRKYRGSLKKYYSKMK